MDNLKCMPLFVLVYVWNSYAIIKDAAMRVYETSKLDFAVIVILGPPS